MSRIHPTANYNDNRCHDTSTRNNTEDANALSQPSVFTVWKRSSMSFQGTDGFTVFDRHGRLAFRVDNYARKSLPGGSVVLMNGSGQPLLTLKPQIFSMQHQWNGYKGEDESRTRGGPNSTSRVFTMRRPSVLSHRSACQAEVFISGKSATTIVESQTPDFRIEGSFGRRNCKIKNPSGDMVAKIARKRVVNNSTIMLSDDVFNVMVQPGFVPELIMAFIIILDRIAGRPFAPALCS